MLETQSQVLNSTIVEKVLIENTSKDGRDHVQQALFIKDSELDLTWGLQAEPWQKSTSHLLVSTSAPIIKAPQPRISSSLTKY